MTEANEALVQHDPDDTRSQLFLEKIRNSKGTGSGPQGTHKTVFIRKKLHFDSEEEEEAAGCRGRCSGRDLAFNAPVSFGAFALLGGLVLFCVLNPVDAKTIITGWQSEATNLFCWLYIGSNGFWLFYIFVIYYYYGHIKLGKDGEKPEFDNSAYFMMIFSAGVAVGLFFYGAGEPLFHYVGASRYSNSGYLNDNEKATNAINLTLYHWGVHGWVVYSLTAIVLGVLSYRYDLPMTYRTCFFPLFGKATWGWLGDMIDTFTIAGCIAGVCTSLGLGADQLVVGGQRMNWIDRECLKGEPDTDDCVTGDETVMRRIAIIAVITLIATMSVVSGLKYGVKFLSQVAFYAGMFLLLMVFFLDSPWYLLNLMVQAFGFYLQWLMQLGWFTDAFGQLNYGSGRDPEGAGVDPAWMDWWTIFYWGWWIAWSPFVGVFLAKISRGRTIAEVINFTFSVPLLYCLVWFCTFGGAGIKMHRKAELLEKAGLEIHGNATFYLQVTNTGIDNCFEVPAKLPCPNDKCTKFKENEPEVCTKCSIPYALDKYATDTNLSPVCKFAGDGAKVWFDLMEQYYGLGWLLSGFSLFAITIYFVTSSDSGSLVVDSIACNGEEAHVATQVFWAFMEGALAMALLYAGGTDALQALQALNIVCGVPFTVFVCGLCISLWDICKYDQGEITKTHDLKDWKLPAYAGIFDYLEYVSSVGGTPPPEGRHVSGFLIATVFPPYPMFIALKTIPGKSHKDEAPGLFVIAGATMAWSAFLVSLVCNFFLPQSGFNAIAFVSYLAFAVCLLIVRSEVRTVYNIEGGVLLDVACCVFLYNQTAWQAAVQCEEPLPPGAQVAPRITLQQPKLEFELEASTPFGAMPE